MIPITKPFLPPLPEYQAMVSTIWENHWLTNMGPLSIELEQKLQQYLNVDNLLLLSSGTTALQIAIKALELKGEIITTPFSFVATVSSIVWEGCTPVFADIDPETLNASPKNIEDAITDKTCAILITHIFGNPCDVQEIQRIATAHHLKILYDAAHAFGVQVNDKSIYDFGDISIGSLHATKIFHSIEGGIVVSKDPVLMKKIAYMRNFGFDGPERFAELGINGKNSEFHAAMGLVNLKYIDEIITRQRMLTNHYDRRLRSLQAHAPKRMAEPNFSYYPLIFDNEALMLRGIENLNNEDIYPRRYFYPSLPSVLPYVCAADVPVADELARRMVCLPLYYDLSVTAIDQICDILLNS
jgi:dTDP-4-amino-4,6-dideoxygalactose transaminase